MPRRVTNWRRLAHVPLVMVVRHRFLPRPFMQASTQGGNSPVAPDWVAEPVGLEPTTKVLWNPIGVRPTPLVGHPSRYRKLCCCVIILAFFGSQSRAGALRQALPRR